MRSWRSFAGAALPTMTWLLFLAGFSLYGGALALRHAWFQTSAWDLGIFDQAVYLIGRGLPAQSSFLGFHILGDHGALVLYPLGWLSRWIPSPALLIGVQAGALAGAVFPLARLARLRGLSRSATAVSLAVLLLYPVVFNTAIFDFHPEVLAFPLVLQSLWWLERDHPRESWRVALALLLALTCKAGLALLVLGFGGWLLWRRRGGLGVSLVGLACGWLGLVGGWLIPAFGGEKAQLLRHAGKFGVRTTATVSGFQFWLEGVRPLLGQIFSMASLAYLLLLLMPVAYVLLHRDRGRFFFGLVPFLPLLLLNLAAALPTLKDLVHHYALFLVPLLAAGVQQTLAPDSQGMSAYPRWMSAKAPLLILAWAVLTFCLFSRLGFYFGTFQAHLDTVPQMRRAMALVQPEAALLTTNQAAPHLSHRRTIAFTSRREVQHLDRYDQVLLDRRHPGWKSSPALVDAITAQLRSSPRWRLMFDQDGVMLFEQLPATGKSSSRSA